MMDEEAERASILAVIEAETEAYLQRDFDVWEKCWHDGPEIRRIHSHVGTGVTVVAGAEIRTQMRHMLAGDGEWEVPETLKRENMNIVLSPEMAWVSYDQTGDVTSLPKELSGIYHELKILHKVDGAWKIACIVGTQLRTSQSTTPQIEVTEDAHILWMNDLAEKRLPDHPMLNQRAGRLQTTKADVMDDLLAALRWLALVKERHTICVGGEAVTRTIALGQDDTGLAHICWTVLRDGKLLVTFDDDERLIRQLEGAAKVFGLSRAQAKLVDQLFQGKDIATAAQTLGVSPNTAKTHLQRIYDKTGVRAQPALVRLLLNAERQEF